MRRLIVGCLVVVSTGCGQHVGRYGSPNGYVRQTVILEGDREGVAALYEGENAKLIHTRMPETELTQSPYYRNRLHELKDKVKSFFGGAQEAPVEAGFSQGS